MIILTSIAVFLGLARAQAPDLTKYTPDRLTRIFVPPEESADQNTERWENILNVGRQFKGVAQRPGLTEGNFLVEMDNSTLIPATKAQLDFLLSARDRDDVAVFAAAPQTYKNFLLVLSPGELPPPPATGVTRIFVVGASWCHYCRPRTGALLKFVGSQDAKPAKVEVVYLEFKNLQTQENLKTPILKAFADAGALKGLETGDITYPSIVVQTSRGVLKAADASPVLDRLLSAATPRRITTWHGSAADRARVERVLMTTVFTDAPDLETKFIRDHNLAGVVVYRRKGAGMKAQDLRTLFAKLRSSSTDPYFVAADQEGGNVQRVMAEDTCRLPPAATLAGKSDAQIERYAEIMTRDLLRVGVNFNFNFAPVVDLKNAVNKDITGWQRSVSEDPREVSRVASILNRVMVSNGMLTMAKHVPGLGTTVNTHDEAAVIDGTFADLRSQLTPFLDLIASPYAVSAVMVGHVMMPKYDGGQILPFSARTLMKLVRREMKFDGLIVNDSFRMWASAKYVPEPDAPLRALLAGVAPISVNSYALDASIDNILVQMQDPQKADAINLMLDTAYQRILRAKTKMAAITPKIDLTRGCSKDDVKFLRSLGDTSYDAIESN